MKQIINRHEVNSLIAASFLVWSLHPEFMHREIISMRNEDFVCWATKQTPGALRTGWLVQARGKKQDFQTCKLWKSEGRSGRWGTQGSPCAHDVRSADAKSWETCLGWCRAAELPPAMWPLNKQDTERQSAVTIRSRRVHQDPRADEGFQSCSAGLPPLVVSSSAAICGLQGSEQFWVTEALKQRWTTPRKWETIDFCLVSCADGHTWLLQVLTEEQADQNLPRLELSPLCQNKEKCYGWTGNALVYWKDN